jgi:hypothetical protein
MKKINYVLFALASLFIIIGILQTSTIFHEYSHYQDYKHLDLEDEHICLYAFPVNQSLIKTFLGIQGHYSFSYKQSQEQEVDYISSYTEIRAYLISFTIVSIGIVCWTFIINLFFKCRELEYQIEVLKWKQKN